MGFRIFAIIAFALAAASAWSGAVDPCAIGGTPRVINALLADKPVKYPFHDASRPLSWRWREFRESLPEAIRDGIPYDAPGSAMSSRAHKELAESLQKYFKSGGIVTVVHPVGDSYLVLIETGGIENLPKAQQLERLRGKHWILKMAVRARQRLEKIRVGFDTEGILDSANTAYYSPTGKFLAAGWESLTDAKKMGLTEVHEWIHYNRSVDLADDLARPPGAPGGRKGARVTVESKLEGDVKADSPYLDSRVIEETDAYHAEWLAVKNSIERRLTDLEKKVRARDAYPIQDHPDLYDELGEITSDFIAMKKYRDAVLLFAKNDAPVLEAAFREPNLKFGVPESKVDGDTYVEIVSGAHAGNRLNFFSAQTGSAPGRPDWEFAVRKFFQDQSEHLESVKKTIEGSFYPIRIEDAHSRIVRRVHALNPDSRRYFNEY